MDPKMEELHQKLRTLATELSDHASNSQDVRVNSLCGAAGEALDGIAEDFERYTTGAEVRATDKPDEPTTN